MTSTNLPTRTEVPKIDRRSDVQEYLEEIQKFPKLSREEEFGLAERYRNEKDVAAAHQLVTSHLHLAARIAMDHRGYGLPVMDLISEANLGLMQAVKRFDPKHGYRLSTYAMHWIKFAVRNFVLHAWSLVRIASTKAQRNLFYNLNKVKRDIVKADHAGLNRRNLTPEEIQKIADTLTVPESEVRRMYDRLSAGQDLSMDKPLNPEQGEESMADTYVGDSSEDSEVEQIIEEDEQKFRTQIVQRAMQTLSPRERDVLSRRRLTAKPETLDAIAASMDISRERVRQIEAEALDKLRTKADELVAASNGYVLPAPPTSETIPQTA